MKAELGPYLLDVDAFRTRRIYSEIARGAVEECGCPWCRNFVAAVRTKLPKPVRSFASLTGIDFVKTGYEVESVFNGRVMWNQYITGYWLCGQIISGPPPPERDEIGGISLSDMPLIDESFHFYFENVTMDPTKKPGARALQFAGYDAAYLAVFVDLPWVLHESWPG